MADLKTRIDPAEARAVLATYAHVLDDGAIGDWPSLFAEDGVYRITTRRNEDQGMPLSIMLARGRGMLFDRVEAIEQANIFEPHYYRHVLSDSRVVEAGEGTLTLSTSFMCVRTMMNGDMCLFAAGRYVDVVQWVEGRLLYRQKTVILDASKVDTLLAIPL